MLAHRQDDDDQPAYLTVPEAARLLRVGRTKAYAMAQQWRATGGKAGLPNVDLGDVLRVPRRALEQVIDDALRPGPPVEAAPAIAPTPLPEPKPKRARRHRPAAPDQPDLFDLPPAS